MDKLRQNIASMKRTNETTNQHYRQNISIDAQIDRYNDLLSVDEQSNSNISMDI